MTMARKYVYPYGNVTRARTMAEEDYIKNGVLYIGSGSQCVLIESENDLDNLEGYAPGAFAYTAGFKGLWMLNSDGEWIDCLEEE